MKGYRPCLDCQKLIPTGGRHRCTECLEANPKANNAGRRGARWRRTRLAVLERDGWICQVCDGRATEVDHIVPLWQLAADDPRREDPDNLRAICGPCNQAIANPTRRGRPQPTRPTTPTDLDRYKPDENGWRNPAPCNLRGQVEPWPRSQWRTPNPAMAVRTRPGDVPPGPDGQWWWMHMEPARHSFPMSPGKGVPIVWFDDDGFLHTDSPCERCSATAAGTPWAAIAGAA